MLRVTCPVIAIATRSETAARTMFRAAVRRGSWTNLFEDSKLLGSTRRRATRTALKTLCPTFDERASLNQSGLLMKRSRSREALSRYDTAGRSYGKRVLRTADPEFSVRVPCPALAA